MALQAETVYVCVTYTRVWDGGGATSIWHYHQLGWDCVCVCDVHTCVGWGRSNQHMALPPARLGLCRCV